MNNYRIRNLLDKLDVTKNHPLTKKSFVDLFMRSTWLNILLGAALSIRIFMGALAKKNNPEAPIFFILSVILFFVVLINVWFKVTSNKKA